MDKPTNDSDDDFELPQFPTDPLPLEQSVVDELNRIIPELPGNNNEVAHVSELDLETDEGGMLFIELPGFMTDDGSSESIVGDEEPDVEELVDVNERGKDSVRLVRTTSNSISRWTKLISLCTVGLDKDWPKLELNTIIQKNKLILDLSLDNKNILQEKKNF